MSDGKKITREEDDARVVEKTFPLTFHCVSSE